MDSLIAPLISCACCHKPFNLSGPHTIAGGRMPLVIPCGHAVCVTCVASLRDGLVCGECGFPAQRRLDEFKTGFPPHLGLVGGLHVAAEWAEVAQKKTQAPPTKVQYIPAGAMIPAKKPKHGKQGKQAKCDECPNEIAAKRCFKCSTNFCERCFSLLHALKEQQTHMVISLRKPAQSRPSDLAKGAADVGVPADVLKPPLMCLAHDGQKLDFLCCECQTSVCAYCKLLADGIHAGHQVQLISTLHHEYKPKIQEAQDKVKVVQQHLETSLKTLKDSGMLTSPWHRVAKQIAEHQAWLLGQAQVKGAELHAMLAKRWKAANEQRAVFEKDVTERLKRIQGLLACAVSYDPQDCVWLVRDLQEACNVPCQLLMLDDFVTMRFSPTNNDAVVAEMAKGCKLELPESNELQLVPHEGKMAEGWTFLDFTKEPSPPKPASAILLDAIVKTTPPTPVQLDLAISTLNPDNDVTSNGGSSCSSVGEFGELEQPDIVHGFIKPGSSEVVTVSHVTDPFDFFVIRCPDDFYRTQLTNKIRKVFRTLTQPESATYGEVVLAKYSGDGRWYRGMVESTGPKLAAVSLLFVDYGNKGTVALKNLRTLPAHLRSVPPLAIRCRLATVQPRGGGDWSNAAIQWFLKIADGHRLLCSVYSVEGGLTAVDVGELPGDQQSAVPLSVCDAAVFMHFAQYIVEPAVNNTDMDLPGGFQRRLEVKFLEPRRWALGDRFTGRVLHVDSPARFYVQRMQCNASYNIHAIIKQLTQLCQPLLRAAGDGENLPVYLPKKGMACAALFSEDLQWYRATVTEVTGDRTVNVFYVDFGNIEVVSCDNIRHLPERFAREPPLAVRCSLYGISPFMGQESFPVEATQMLTEMTRDLTVDLTVVKVVANFAEYEMVVEPNRDAGGDEANFAQHLVDAGLAERTASVEDDEPVEKCKEPFEMYDTASTRHKSRRRRPNTAAFNKLSSPTEEDDSDDGQEEHKDKVHVPIKPEAMTDPSLTEIVFVKCIAPDCIFISLKSAIYHFTDMKDAMQLYYAKTARSEQAWLAGDRCAALRPADRLWHRGIVRHIDDEHQVALVELRDIVQRELIALAMLRPLEDQFMRVREAIFTVSLGGVTPAGGSDWTTRAKEYALRWCRSHRPTHIVKRGEVEGSVLPVELFAQETVFAGPFDPTVERFVSLNQELVAEGLALPMRGAQDWRQFTAEEMLKEVEQSVQASDWKFPDQVDGKPGEWPGVLEGSSRLTAYWQLIGTLDMVCFEATPTNVDVFGFIYLHSVHDEPTLQSMTAQLQRQFGNAGPTSGDFPLCPGMPCVTRYFLDGMWYRSEIVKELADGRWKVLFVDFGNTMDCAPNEIRLTSFLAEIPVLCRKVALANIQPIAENGCWTRDGLDDLHAQIVDQRCTVSVRCPVGTVDPVTVTMVRADGLNFSSFMVEKGHARWGKVEPGQVPGQPPPKISDDDLPVPKKTKKKKGGLRRSKQSGNSKDSLPAEPAKFQADEVAALRAGGRVSPDVIIEEQEEVELATQVSQNQRKCDAFLEEDHTFEANEEREIMTAFEDKCIISDDNDIIVDYVEYITLGEKNIVDDNVSGDEELVVLDEENGSVEESKGEDVDEDDIDANVVVGDVEEEGLDVSVVAEVVETTDAASTRDSTSEEEKVSNTSSDVASVDSSTGESGEEKVAPKFCYYQCPAVESFPVVVKAMESAHAVRFVALDSASPRRIAKLLELEAQLQEDAPVQARLVWQQLPVPCVACFTADGVWRRAMLVNVATDGSRLGVWDVDGSMWEYLEADRVRECKPEWMALPTLLLVAQLPCVKLAPGFSAPAAMEVLRELLVGKTFTARVLAVKPELAVELFDEGTLNPTVQPLIDCGLLIAAEV